MNETLTPRQTEILRLLATHGDGRTIDELAEAMGISRPATRQHLAPLENGGLILRSAARATGGRPVQSYVLSAKGRERFPRQYGWFAGLLLAAIKQRRGDAETMQLMRDLAADVADGLAAGLKGKDQAGRLAAVAALMSDLGYDAAPGAAALVATNCVFHHLAAEHPEVCEFDLELLRRLIGAEVAHETCMVRGAGACTFRFGPSGNAADRP
jgi:predicted ArsR family transcriptional regulator